MQRKCGGRLAADGVEKTFIIDYEGLPGGSNKKLKNVILDLSGSKTQVQKKKGKSERSTYWSSTVVR